jgi:CheY-like chemotaxis protein
MSPVTERTILVIDDARLMREVARVGLSRAPWAVVLAEDGESGLAAAAKIRPDCILLDVEMPGLNGPETLQRLHSETATREIPVVFLTGHSSPPERAKLEALGAVGVIAKPFDPSALVDEISELLGWSP